jgi:hypothetical protein
MASVVLLTLCLLVILSNYLDRVHTRNVKDSISTMYEDRLIVEEYILKMTRNTYQIRELLLSPHAGRPDDIKSLTADFKSTYGIFIKTRLTTLEKSTAVKLKTQIREFENLQNHQAALNQTEGILTSLGKLSEIQLEESKRIMKQVEAQYATTKTLSQFAFGIVIIILIVLQVLVFSGETLFPIFKPKDPSLN